MCVRRGRSEDANEIAALWLRSRGATVRAIPEPVHTDEEVHRWFEQGVLPAREVWVAENESTVVGIVVLEDDWVDQLYMDPDHTGQGIGAKLMSVAKQQRPSGLRLWTFQSNLGPDASTKVRASSRPAQPSATTKTALPTFGTNGRPPIRRDAHRPIDATFGAQGKGVIDRHLRTPLGGGAWMVGDRS